MKTADEDAAEKIPEEVDTNPANQELKKEALERAAKIREHREEIIARRPLPKVISAKTTIQNGRIVTLYLMDGSKEFGRGNCYWLAAGHIRAA